jgi:hypothetical protein
VFSDAGDPLFNGPTVIATHQGQPTGLTVDSSNVYWVDSSAGTVNKAPLEGGPVTVLARDQDAPWDVCIDANNLYWVNRGDHGVYSYGLDGGAKHLIAYSQDAPWKVVVNNGRLYWVSESGTIETVSVEGGCETVFSSPGGSLEGLTVVGDLLYSLDGASGDLDETNLDGGAVTRLVKGPSVYGENGRCLTSDHGVLFYTTGPSDLYALPIGSTQPVLLASSENNPKGLVADANFVYVVDINDGLVRAVSLSTGVESTVAMGAPQSQPVQITQTASSIYWVDLGVSRDGAVHDGFVMAAPKCSADGGC